jgi:hypothetical protein
MSSKEEFLDRGLKLKARQFERQLNSQRWVVVLEKASNIIGRAKVAFKLLSSGESFVVILHAWGS